MNNRKDAPPRTGGGKPPSSQINDVLNLVLAMPLAHDDGADHYFTNLILARSFSDPVLPVAELGTLAGATFGPRPISRTLSEDDWSPRDNFVAGQGSKLPTVGPSPTVTPTATPRVDSVTSPVAESTSIEIQVVNEIVVKRPSSGGRRASVALAEQLADRRDNRRSPRKRSCPPPLLLMKNKASEENLADKVDFETGDSDLFTSAIVDSDFTHATNGFSCVEEGVLVNSHGFTVWDLDGSLRSGSSAMVSGAHMDTEEAQTVQRGVGFDELEDLGIIGRGGQGVVRKVLHRPTSRYLACKSLALDQNPRQRTVIARELRALYFCRCPQIVKFRGAFFENLSVKICMEFMSAGSLRDLYMEVGAMSEDAVAAVGISVLRALVYLKNNNTMHRDVKPDNILLDFEGRVKLADLGISVITENSLASSVVGTVRYLAPERIASANGPKDYSYSSDVWSLGLTLAELSLGRYPYPLRDDPEPLKKGERTARLSHIDCHRYIVNGDAPTVPSPRFSASFVDLLMGLLIKNPSERATPEACLRHPSVREHIKRNYNITTLISEAFPKKFAALGKDRLKHPERYVCDVSPRGIMPGQSFPRTFHNTSPSLSAPSLAPTMELHCSDDDPVATPLNTAPPLPPRGPTVSTGSVASTALFRTSPEPAARASVEAPQRESSPPEEPLEEVHVRAPSAGTAVTHTPMEGTTLHAHSHLKGAQPSREMERHDAVRQAGVRKAVVHMPAVRARGEEARGSAPSSAREGEEGEDMVDATRGMASPRRSEEGSESPPLVAGHPSPRPSLPADEDTGTPAAARHGTHAPVHAAVLAVEADARAVRTNEATSLQAGLGSLLTASPRAQLRRQEVDDSEMESESTPDGASHSVDMLPKARPYTRSTLSHDALSPHSGHSASSSPRGLSEGSAMLESPPVVDEDQEDKTRRGRQQHAPPILDVVSRRGYDYAPGIRPVTVGEGGTGIITSDTEPGSPFETSSDDASGDLRGPRDPVDRVVKEEDAARWPTRSSSLSRRRKARTSNEENSHDDRDENSKSLEDMSPYRHQRGPRVSPIGTRSPSPSRSADSRSRLSSRPSLGSPEAASSPSDGAFVVGLPYPLAPGRSSSRLDDSGRASPTEELDLKNYRRRQPTADRAKATALSRDEPTIGQVKQPEGWSIRRPSRVSPLRTFKTAPVSGKASPQPGIAGLFVAGRSPPSWTNARSGEAPSWTRERTTELRRRLPSDTGSPKPQQMFDPSSRQRSLSQNEKKEKTATVSPPYRESMTFPPMDATGNNKWRRPSRLPELARRDVPA